jgi:hypothetical protein
MAGQTTAPHQVITGYSNPVDAPAPPPPGGGDQHQHEVDPILIDFLDEIEKRWKKWCKGK